MARFLLDTDAIIDYLLGVPGSVTLVGRSSCRGPSRKPRQAWPGLTTHASSVACCPRLAHAPGWVEMSSHASPPFVVLRDPIVLAVEDDPNFALLRLAPKPVQEGAEPSQRLVGDVLRSGITALIMI